MKRAISAVIHTSKTKILSVQVLHNLFTLNVEVKAAFHVNRIVAKRSVSYYVHINSSS